MKKCMSILTIIALLCTMLGVSQLVFAQAEEEGLSLASLSDIHYLDEGSMGGKNAAWQAFERGNAKQLEQTPALLESAFAQIARDMQESDFPYLLVAGDLTREGEYNAHVELAARLERFQRETGIPVFVTNGNHDINNSLALDFSSGKRETGRITTQAEFREIYQNLGFNRAVSSYTPPAGK